MCQVKARYLASLSSLVLQKDTRSRGGCRLREGMNGRRSYLVPGTVLNTSICTKSLSLPSSPVRVSVSHTSVSEIWELKVRDIR